MSDEDFDDPLPDDDDGDYLSPAELAALTASLQDRGRQARASRDVREEAEPIVLRYDLVGASASPQYEMPALDLVQERFAVTLASLLARATRQEGMFTAVAPEVVNFSEVYASLRMPCGVVLVDVLGIGGSGLVLIDPTLLMHLIDLLIGGQGGPSSVVDQLSIRGFTSAERHLIGRVIKIVGAALESAWSDISPMGLRMVRAEADPRHAAIFMPGDRVADFRIEVQWGDVLGDVRFVIPMEALRPFERRLARTTSGPSSAPDTEWHDALTLALREVRVPVTALLGRTSLSLREIQELSVGDIVRLDRGPDGVAEVLLAGAPKFAASPTVVRGNMAINVRGRLRGVEADDEDGGDADDGAIGEVDDATNQEA